jgi:hypothetical protein
VQLDTSALGANRNVTVIVSKSTVLRRYAPGSVNFDDAAPAPIEQIKVGDQLRARGSRAGDGTTLSAEEVVSGSFHNIAGTVTSIDTGASTVVVNDLATKKPVTIKVGPATQLKKLPQPMAQRIAARLKGGSEEAAAAPAAGAQGAPGEAGRPTANPAPGAPPAGGAGNGEPGGSASGSASARRGESVAGAPTGSGAGGERGGDFQQAIARMPAAKLADLQKGDAVMVVATSDSSGSITAITLLAGVEPILQASPSGGQSLLTPWSLSGGAAGGDAAAQ